MKNNEGFSLVEMTVVMIIAGLMLSGGMKILSAQIYASRQAESKLSMEVSRLALISFISRNGRLPCPAVPTVAQGTADYGVEATTLGVCDGLPTFGAPASAVVVTGIIPWVSLGISDSSALDGHYNRLTYQVVRDATAAASETHKVAGMRGNITLHSNAPPTATNQINNCSGGLTYNSCAAVAIVVSHGRNGFGAYTQSGMQIPLTGAGPGELENTNNDNVFVKKEYSEAAGILFDDSVLPLSSADLLTQLALNGSVKDARSEVMQTIESMKGEIIAYAISHSFFLPTPPPSIKFDVWGTAVNYTRVVTPITPATAPGVAFTLTSSGPDAVLGTSDDIGVVVSVGELQGVFSKSGGFANP